MKLIVILLLLFLYGIGNNMIHYGYGLSDAFWRVVWAIDEGTVWTKGFSEKNFSQIKLGMTKKEVLKLVGEPLDDIDECDGVTCFWAYTRQDSPTSDFDQRWVVFDHHGKVIEVRKSFYID